ncbi:MAG: hypothetical protein IPJ31_07480 [Bacteroidetes bacterium]|nr:hypothetical protein [Bacteroidota bacterium]
MKLFSYYFIKPIVHYKHGTNREGKPFPFCCLSAEMYYSYDFSNQEVRQARFLYNHKRHHEGNVNLILVQAYILKRDLERIWV